MEIAAGADNEVFMITGELLEIDHHGISYPPIQCSGVGFQTLGFARMKPEH